MKTNAFLIIIIGVLGLAVCAVAIYGFVSSEYINKDELIKLTEPEGIESMNCSETISAYKTCLREIEDLGFNKKLCVDEIDLYVDINCHAERDS